MYNSIGNSRTLTKSEKAPLRVCHYDSYVFGDDLNLWPLTSKCKGTFLSSSCIYVWNMKAVRWKLVKLSCQNQSVHKVPLWAWLLTPKCIGIFFSPSCIYVWTMKAVRWKVVKLLCQDQSVDKVLLWPWPFDPNFLSPSCIYVWKLYIENYSSYRVRTKVLTKFCCDLELWHFDPKMCRYLSLALLHLCMKYESCTLKTSQVIVSEPKCWQCSVVNLTFDLLTPKCIKVSSSCHPASMYEIWKLYIENKSGYRVRTKVLTKFHCDLDLWPQNV